MKKIGKVLSKTIKYLFDERKFLLIQLSKLQVVKKENSHSFSDHGLIKYFVSQFHFDFFKRIVYFIQLMVFDKHMVFLKEFLENSFGRVKVYFYKHLS